MLTDAYPRLVDLRAEQRPEGPPKSGLVRKGRLVARDPKTIDAICLHQTARFYGVAPYQVLAAKGDRTLALHRRGLDVHAHVTAWTTGKFTPCYPLTAYVWHGNGANARSIGLEVEGLYNGKPGGSDAEPKPETIDAAREAVRWIVAEAAREGITIRYVLAHRQYSDSRRADPGWRIWRDVGLWSETALGLVTLPLLTDTERGQGRPIPAAWDPRQTAAY